jgi:hypothetical protein
MRVEPNTAKLLPAQAAQYFLSNRTGGPVSTTTVVRYARQGVILASGHRLKLQMFKYPGGLYTTLEAIQEFLRAQNDDWVARQEIASATSDPNGCCRAAETVGR